MILTLIKGEGLIAMSTNINRNDYVLLRRHIAALNGLCKNNNIIMSSSDKGLVWFLCLMAHQPL